MTYKHIPIEHNFSINDSNLVVYSIVRKSLEMSSGKIAGQCQHAMQYLMQFYFKMKYNIPSENSNIFLDRYESWMNNSFHSKVILTASDKEWEKLREEYEPLIVIDAGKTEIAAGSETVMILYPMLKEERSKTLKRCQAL